MENLELAEERKLAVMYLKNTETPENNLVFEIDGANLIVDDKELVKNIKLKVSYGDRVVIAGDNGSGKTQLIKALLKLGNANAKDTVLGNAHLDGSVEVNNDLRWVYIDQNYSSVHPDLTLIENLMQYNTSYTEAMAKEQLGKFRFNSPNEMKKLGSNLSGGEMVRLVMAMITAFPIDLIILDEPTNNLDVETVEILSIALNKFRGAIIVISHNIDFLNDIDIKTAYKIKDSKLKIMNVNPSHKDDYYKALLE